MKKAFFKMQRVWLPIMAILGSGCSSPVSLSFSLINPCMEDVLYKNNQCQFFELVVSSFDPKDDLHPCYISESGKGPRARTCTMADGKCSLDGEDMIGPARMVDLRCRTTIDGAVVARASSQAMLVDDGTGGSFNLLVGNTNGFVETTILSRSSPQFAECSKMGQGEIGRYGHTATVLSDGRVFIAGGIRRLGTVEEVLATAEIFDPLTGIHQMVIDNSGNPVKMLAPSGRAFHTATLLRDGRVLLAGGFGLIEGKRSTIQSAELFDPATNNFQAVSVMGSGRAHHTATMLATGEVLVVGGASYNAGNIVNYDNNAILYRPQSNSWEQVSGTMSVARAFHAAVLLDPAKHNGNSLVVVIGGEDQNGTHNSIDIYNYQNSRFEGGVGVTMQKNRSHLCAVALNNGDVLVSGGNTVKDDIASVDNGVEIYNPNEPAPYGQFRPLSLNLNVGRMDHTCTLLDGGWKFENGACSLLPTGKVLIAGGESASGAGVGVGELVVVGTGAGNYEVRQITDDFLNPPRFHHRASLLQNGWVFISGGLPSNTPTDLPVTQSLYYVPEPVF